MRVEPGKLVGLRFEASRGGPVDYVTIAKQDRVCFFGKNCQIWREAPFFTVTPQIPCVGGPWPWRV